MTKEVYYAKIMLFGEYSVICDSMGLTIPYAHFTGGLRFLNQEEYTNKVMATQSNCQLGSYLKYLRELQTNKDFHVRLDLNSFEKDIKNGLYFESNIPQGYGIGSSGALVAAIYDRYVANDPEERKIFTGREISNLKEVFSKMESFYHGISSGIDPLLCYIRHPLLIRNKLQIETVGIPRDRFGKDSAVFLIDSGVKGKTGPLVNMFLERCKDQEYMNQVETIFIPSVNGCINTLLKGDMDPFFNHLTELSAFQYLYLPEMIPEGMKALWQAGLQNDDFKMKLCGSGGGGFILGISRNFKKTRKYLKQEGFEPVPVF